MKKNVFCLALMLCFILPGFSGSFLPAQEPGSDPGMDYIEHMGDGASMNWTTKALRVKGNGFGPERVKQLGRRKILAKRAAKVDAYRNLVEAIKGVNVTSETSVEDMMLESDSIRTRTGGMLKGMRVVDVTYSGDGGCEVTVEVNIDRDGRFLLSALNNGEVRVTDNYPKFDWNKVRENLHKTRTQLAHSRSELNKTKKELRDKEDLIAANRREAGARALNVPPPAAPPENQESNQPVRAVAVQVEKTAPPENRESNQPVRAVAVQVEKTAPPENRESNQPVKAVTVQVEKTAPPEVKKDFSGLLVDARGLGLKPTLAPSILSRKQEKIYGIGVIPTHLVNGSTADYLPGNIEHAKKHKKIHDCPLVVKGVRAVKESDIMIDDEDVQKLVAIRDLLEQAKVVILL